MKKMGKRKINEIIQKLLSEDRESTIEAILSNISWPRGVKTGCEYFVEEDDNDGVRRGIGLSFLPNGDGILDFSHCVIESHFAEAEIFTTPHVYRFRNVAGSGRKPLIHGALLLLSEAVVLSADEEIING